jgi:hypothetical protein
MIKKQKGLLKMKKKHANLKKCVNFSRQRINSLQMKKKKSLMRKDIKAKS